MSDSHPHHLEIAGTVYVEQGEGAAVVFVHGSLSDFRSWDHQRESIAASYRFIALNLRYHGTAPWPNQEAEYSVVRHAEQVIDYIRALNAAPVHLIGHSYGAQVVLHVALQAPELLRSMVLHEPPGDSLVTGPNASAVREERIKMLAPANEAVKAGCLEDAARLMITAVMNRGPDLWEAASESSRAMMLENARTLPLQFSAPPAAPVDCEQLGRIKLPALVINGAETTEYFDNVGRGVAACIPGCRREVIPDTTHGSQDQDVETYNRVLLKFLGAQK